MGADNQQERLNAEWITGFVDGEGCFYVGINRVEKARLGWQVLPEFRVVQHKRDEQILERMCSYFGFGSVEVNHGDRKEFRVRGLDNLNKLVEFFTEHPLHTKKRMDFKLFSQVIDKINRKEHLTKDGMKEIAEIASRMNMKVIPRFLESSETIRRGRETAKI
ncbi:LAGLIDADG family homing endonuclease [Candidatus Micrarchaeota archaeon]|nr:LAGLIDADG family homing endonuclease [Candidatus Micrarchaeota archaeon]